MSSILVVEVSGLGKIYSLAAENVEALRGIDLRLTAGEFVALVGASGAGKTTLLNLLGCLDRPTDGSIHLLGSALQGRTEAELTRIRRERIGFVFQDPSLIPTLTALENVGLPLSFARSTANGSAPERALSQVGLAEKGHRYPEELSGGERQRVAIARALVRQPALLLADEPTGNLDSQNGQRIFSLFRELTSGGDRTVLVATHNLELAGLADRRLFLRDGRLEEGGVVP